MTTGFMETEIQRNNRSLLILSLLCLLAVGVGVVLNVRYLYNFVLGPFNITREDLTSLTVDSKPLQYFVTVSGDDLADTGFDWISQDDSGNKTVKATYLALLLGDRILLVKSPKGLKDSTPNFSGKLATIPADIQSGVIDKLVTEYPNLKGAFLPLMLDAGDFRTDGFYGLAVAAIFSLLGLFGLLRSLLRLDSTRHPVMKQLERLGNPEYITSRINMEMAGEHIKIGSMHVSQSWLVQSAMASMKVARMEDLVWGYKLVTQHRTYGIPTRKTFSALIFDRNGTQLTSIGKEKDIDRLLMEVRQRAPWMIAGFSNELAQAWRKDRQVVIASVDARRMGSMSRQVGG